MRLFALLELIASKTKFVSLQEIVEEVALPKPTLHRMLQQLERAGLLFRQADGRHYGTSNRLHCLAENLLLNSSQQGARRTVLRQLVEDVGESCNLTTLSGNEILYLDRADTPEPLRFYLRPGWRAPVHCSASGKMILSQMGRAQRQKLLKNAPLKRFTPQTITDPLLIEEEIARAKQVGYATDDQEFLPGLICVAVLVPGEPRSNLCVAVQAPATRLSVKQALEFLPSMLGAAEAIRRIDADDLDETELLKTKPERFESSTLYE